MNGAKLLQTVASGGFGWTIATQVFAVQHGYQEVLGTPVLQWGVVKLYTPLQGMQWTWAWVGSHPQLFTLAGVTCGLVTGGLLALTYWPAPPPEAPKATWATTRQLRRARLFRAGGMVVGKWGGRIIRHLHPGHMLGIAVTQSGKSTSLVAPTVLDDDQHSMLVNDPKDEGAAIPGGEIYHLTAGWRATCSKVMRFQPLSATSHQYDPLQGIRLGMPQEIRDLHIVSDMLVDPDGDGGGHTGEAGQHFRDGASDIHTGVLAHGLYSRMATTLGAFYKLWCGNLQLPDLIHTMETTRHVNGQCHPAVVNAVRLLKETADRELSALINTARRALRLWADPLVCRATARSDFTMRDLREGLRPLTLYLSFPFSDIERLRPLSRLIWRQCLEHAASRKHGWDWPLWAILDEFQTLRRLPILAHGLNTFLGMGVTMCLITPSLNEIEDVWGGKHPFLEGCSTKVVFGIRDGRVADRFTDSIGSTEATHERESWSEVPGNLIKRKTTSTEERDEPLVSRTAVLELDERKALAKIGRYTVLLDKAYYKHHRTWWQRSLIPPPGPRSTP